MNIQLCRPVSFWSVACCSQLPHLVFSAAHFAFAASHSSVVHFSTSATVEDAEVGALVVDGKFGSGGEDGVCAEAAPVLMRPARATVDRPSDCGT